jgi:hypothetical protein
MGRVRVPALAGGRLGGFGLARVLPVIRVGAGELGAVDPALRCMAFSFEWGRGRIARPLEPVRA